MSRGADRNLSRASTTRETTQSETMKTIKSGAGMNRHRSEQDFSTPNDFFDAVVRRFGAPFCDLAASKANRKAEVFIDEKRNSLKAEWYKIRGILWLNPPFGNISVWALKCALEAKRGARILLLTPASVGSDWFDRYIWKRAFVLAVRPRLSFDGKNSYPKDCILSCFNIAGVPPQGFDTWRWDGHHELPKPS